MHTFEFPVGYHTLHKTKIIDYQLNRWYSLGYCRLEDMREAGANIDGLADWKDEQVRLAEKALAEGRLLNGTFHIRAAEFFTHHTDPDKLAQRVHATREHGYALVDQELEEGLRSIAVPVLDAKDSPMAAINISTQAARVSKSAMLRDFLPRLKDAASKIGAAIT